MTVKEYICKPGKYSKIIINYDQLTIKPKSVLMIGLAGVGLLGTIITDTLITQIEDIIEIGFITSDLLSPLAVFHEGVLKNPFRIYYSAKTNIIIAKCDIPFNTAAGYNDLGKTIISWALSDDIDVKEVVVFQGMPHDHPIDDFPVYYAANEQVIKKLGMFELERLDKGITTGPEAMIVNEALKTQMNVYLLFTAVQLYPTPEGAASVIKVLNKIYDLNINTDKLTEEGKEIKTRMLDLARTSLQYYQQQDMQGGKPKDYSSFYG